MSNIEEVEVDGAEAEISNIEKGDVDGAEAKMSNIEKVDVDGAEAKMSNIEIVDGAEAEMSSIKKGDVDGAEEVNTTDGADKKEEAEKKEEVDQKDSCFTSCIDDKTAKSINKSNKYDDINALFEEKTTCDPCIECNKITMAELMRHNDPASPWIAIKGSVYDVTTFLQDHPGGPDILIENAGRDATRVFEDVGHSKDAKTLLKKYKIGVLQKEKDLLKNYF